MISFSLSNRQAVIYSPFPMSPEQRCHLFVGESGYAAIDTCDAEKQFRMLPGVFDELIDVWPNGLNSAVHAGEITAKNKDLIRFETCDILRCDSLSHVYSYSFASIMPQRYG